MDLLPLRTNIDFYEQRFLMFVLDQMAYEYEQDNKDVIRMTLGKSELPLHPQINAAMAEAINDFSKSSKVFPAGLPELRNRLSEYYLEKYGVHIPSRHFIIGSGTSSIFRNLFQLLLNHEDEVLLPSPYYSLYNFSALLAGAKIRYYLIDEQSMSVDMSSFRANLTPRTKVVVINSPGNPLGNIITKEEMLEIDTLVNGQAVIIHDEIYANMSFDSQPISSVQLENTRSAFITTNAFSKGHRMYARRVGYCIVPEQLIEPLTVIQHHTLLTLDPVVQYGAIAALDLHEEVEVLVGLYRDRRNYTVESFEPVPDVKVLHSNGGFYITLDCSSYIEKQGMADSLELATQIIESTYVAVVPGSDFGMPSSLRLSFSSSKYKEGIDRLVQYFIS
ncbi:pyridoxal phosphate-dependent aminotransferase [Cohnella abietis]|uniref:Aspartate aminotransferase n=1 Tax=Cohnella abietis TaxID=2507935 RepID=A0A3T1D1C1_9BACL|nr:pyridoxal phosphate-dependent aminotransferase [Cohnella abietis]BBI31851.1 aspartate aminotransferase [Cohnella abietis]